ncbi:PREDICTED: protein FAM161B [Chrysochloris asiatica]|uniref:Protein FAM161B n=1 Tax=Chrysochloris asiatica TaxID=185453 RepID=A0A9B0TIU0_CHRAS|nr:PREDICTED: protein FAM161B [Chrysochloris asiatica]
MTVGRPAGAPGGSEWGDQIFPPKSSSDTEAEEELSEDVLVLPRAGKLDEFLSPDEETESTSDSAGSFYKSLEVLTEEGRHCLLQSLYQSDSDSDGKLSEENGNLESVFQDKGREKPQVWSRQSLRYGSTRRCSSLSSLPSDSPRDQPSPPRVSGPSSQHRSISSWASSITVPQPFHMTLREARKKAQRLASLPSFEHVRQQAQRQGQEEAECHRQFQAQPVPAHVYLPLYQEILERSEARRRAGVQQRKELLLSSLKPFSFLAKEEQRKEAARQRDLAATVLTKVPKQKATKKIPKSILEPALGDKLQEAELFRKIRIQMRALDMLRMASSPIPSSSSRVDPQSRTATRTREEKLGFLQTNFEFQPRVNPTVPDYEGLYKAFQRRAAKRRETREGTHNKPFLLRTANLRHTQRPGNTDTTGGRRDSPQPASPPLPRSRSLSGLASLSANTLPVHITDATRKRESAVRSSLEKRDKADESIQWLEMHKKKCQAMSKSVTLRSKALDPHKSLEEVFKAKLKENRNNDRKRAKEYKKELEEMKKRIQTRPYLFEQVTKDLARKAAEQRYRDTLKQAGLDEDFVRSQGQSTGAKERQESGVTDPYRSIHEMTKLQIREPQDSEESLELPAGLKTDLEELSFGSLNNLKSVASSVHL